MLDVNLIKKDFPIFNFNPRLVYLDSTATTLKPKSVIDKLQEYYSHYSANIFRGVYKISEKATEEYEKTRIIIAEFINAKSPSEIIFTRNTTESLNLIAYSLGRKIIEKGDEIVTTIMEHHSNFVPWQQLALENGADFKIININGEGRLILDELDKIITKKTKIFALTQVSNVLGTINPVKEIIKRVKKINSKTVIIVDVAQSIAHFKIDVQKMGADFIAFSSHKMLGPTGVGILWGKETYLENMFPFNFGGEMIEEVYLDRTVFKKSPHKFEAGTPAIGEVIALKQSVSYLKEIGWRLICDHEKMLTEYGLKRLKEEFNNITITGSQDAKDRGGIISFNIDKIHPHDLAQILDENNIAVRAGQHCAMPLHMSLNTSATLRVSFYIYNTKEDIDKLVFALKKAIKVLT